MNHIFVLWHSYEFNHCDGYEELEQKCLGVYSTKEKAEQAAERYYKLLGFNKYPFDYFCIDKIEVNKDSAWEEGFINPDGEYFSDIQN